MQQWSTHLDFPFDPWTATVVILRMLADEGRVWPTPNGQRISVLDDLSWEAVPVNLTSPSGLAMPTAAATAVSVADILSFADHLASKYKIYSCFYRALNIVAMISGSRWSLVPLFADFPTREEGRRHANQLRREPNDFNRRLANAPGQATAAVFEARPLPMLRLRQEVPRLSGRRQGMI